MTFEAVNWSEVLAIFTLLSGVAGAAFMLLRTRFSTIFVSRREHENLERRVDDLDERLARVPSHQDIANLTEKLGGLSREVAVVGESVGGVRASIGRVEHMIDMLIKQQLEREVAK